MLLPPSQTGGCQDTVQESVDTFSAVTNLGGSGRSTEQRYNYH